MNPASQERESAAGEKPFGISSFLKTAGCGLAMGMADIVPGVSGGTVALVLGIYQRLVTAISRFDRTFLGHVRRMDVRAAARHIDLVFLVSLAAGILVGLVVTVLTLSKLLENDGTRPFVLAVFFGLVVGSVWLVMKMIAAHAGFRPQANKSDPIEILKRVNWIALLAGSVVAGVICWISPGGESGAIPLWYVFLCGMIAICAMILPGISGALILLLLGAYVYVVDAFKSVLHRESLSENLLIFVVFASGCAIGLFSFSKILRGLLEHRYHVTMSLLCGLMIGSLFKLWPFQKDLTPIVEEFKHKIFQPILPESINGQTLGLLATMVVAAILAVAVDRIARRSNTGV